MEVAVESRLEEAATKLSVYNNGPASGDESSGDEGHVPPKKNRLKEPCGSSSNSSEGKQDSGSNGEEDPNQGDDESSGHSNKERGCLTSGENSDAEGGMDGDENSGISLKTDEAKKMFECDVCNMRFSNGANMRRHRMRHTGVKPYECRVCQKRFFRKDHLAEHMATHSKLLPFRCPICNKGFQRQIAMRAHFQNEHVGGSQDMVKACPLCSFRVASMKSLRVHFFSRHGIDLDNPMPQSPSLGSRDSPGPSGEYSELAHALGFEERDKGSEALIPSHFLVPQIEMSSNSPYPPHFSFTADSSYGFQDERHGRDVASPNVSPLSDSSSNLPSSSDFAIVVKKELISDDHLPCEDVGRGKRNSVDISDDIQDVPEDLSSGSGNGNYSSGSTRCESPKTSSSSLIKVSPLKSLLRDWRKEISNASGSSRSTERQRNQNHDSSDSIYSTNNQNYETEKISSSNGPESSNTNYGRRGNNYGAPLHQCVYCGIIFPDKTLYFLHKGCHSESNPWRCNICGESSTNVYDFNSHLLSKSHQ